MKEIIVTCITVLFFISLSNAQSVVGGGLAYGTEIDELGVGIDGVFHLTDNFSVSPDVIIYFVEDGANLKRGFWEFNTNLHYNFSGSSAAQVYGLAGINLSTFTTKPDGFNRNSNTELGLNLGIGSDFDINSNIKPFAEFKFTLGDFDQAVLLFGIKFPLK